MSFLKWKFPLLGLLPYRNIYSFGLYRLHCSVNLSGVNPVFVPSADTDLEATIIVSVSKAIDIFYLHNMHGLPNFGIEDMVVCTSLESTQFM